MSGQNPHVPFEPRTLTTTEDELRELSVDFARRRVAFTEAWLEASGLNVILDDVQSREEDDWTESCVDEEAREALTTAGFSATDLHLVFAHPDAIATSPANLVYYRRLLSMSNKVFARLFPQLTRRRTQHPETLDEEELAEVLELNNMLAQVANRAGVSPEDPLRLVLLSEGAAIDGDWRNQIGRIATAGAFEAMIACFDNDELTRATFMKGSDTMEISDLPPNERSVLIDQRWKPELIEVGSHRIRFGSQRVGNLTVNADITVARVENGVPVVVEAAGEVKGSTDPANAMERWRLASGNIAAMNRIRSGPAHRRPTTFYVGLTITENVVEGTGHTAGMRELLNNSTLDAAFSIVKFADPVEVQRFCNFFRPQVSL